jgi:putative restriction endonuclease
MPNYWMVVQSKSYQDEIPGGFLWAPITSKSGAKLPTYTSMKEVKKGDIVFSLVNPGDGLELYATGVCTEEYVDCENPLMENKDKWIKEGWKVGVRWTKLETTHKIKDHINDIRPLLPDYSSPLRANGEAAYSCYLHRISEQLANLCLRIIGSEYQQTTDDDIEEGIRGRIDIGPTVKARLVNSRHGQGIFRENVFKNEKGCRVTGVTDPKLLNASHIKPWAVSTDEEKLDGCNGFLLTPTIDRLFDKGLLSFKDDGSIMVSRLIDDATIINLGLDKTKNVGGFNKKQCEYLKYHRNKVFKV